ncbi:helix-turn-helix domain-containing protein [Agrococcus sp. KRD186]|uniref:helix-turn-helix domain-containing protein n=1 Tax=Agrococcus sp. KRD186 TaxID=2729730 RepID=UPI001F497C01|nr:helix-turn-helix domain-containing protein [Agrococcus sp. KRD186]
MIVDRNPLDPYTDLRALGAAYITQDDVASVCRVTPETLKNWRHKGTGPPSTRGKMPLYRASDVADWLDAQIR